MGANHVRVWSEMEGVELVALCDPLQAARERAGRGRSCAQYSSVEEMLDAERPEVLSIVTPTALHEECVAAAVSRGVHVVVEKPVAADVDTASRIDAMAHEAGVVAMVGHIERFNPAVLELRARLHRGEIGRIFKLSSQRVGPFPPRIRDVGVVQDLATHDLDQIRYLLGGRVEMVFAQTERHINSSQEDMVVAVGRARGERITVPGRPPETLARSVIFQIDVNWMSPRKIRESVVIGEGGMLVADTLTQDLFLYDNSYEEGSWRMLSALRGVSEGNMTRFALRRVEPLRAELEAFATAVREGRPSPCPLSDGVEALRLAEAILRSAREAAPVEVPER